MFEHAVDLALQGFAVFPLKPGTKKPMFKGWERLASTDPEQITRWWNAAPAANIGIACGPSNLLVIDLDKAKKPDGPRHGQETLAKLAAGRELPRTFTVASARGGRHLYFRRPEGAALSITAGSDTTGLGPLVDTRGRGGFIVAPGSVFEGGTYRIEQEAAVAPLPAWIADELTKRPAAQEPLPAPAPSQMPVPDRRRSAYGKAALQHSADTVTRAPEGTRNDTLNRESFRMGRLVGGGVIDRGTAYSTLFHAARKAGLPPEECAKTITSGLTAGVNRPRHIPDRDHTSTRKPQPPTKETQVSTTTETTQNNASASTTAELRTATAPPPQAEQSLRDEGAESAHVDEPTAPIDLSEVLADTLARVKQAQDALPDVLEFANHDELRHALNEVRAALAQVTTLYSPAARPDTEPNNPDDQAAGYVEPNSEPEQMPVDPVEDLEDRLAGVDAAYSEAEARGVPAASAEWAGVRAIHSAIHNLWDTLKAAAGTYWAEVAADIRTHGLLAALATRACKAIANLATAAAERIQRSTLSPSAAAGSIELGLREAFINARNHVHAHATSHEWQRIAALWGTVNTLSRQTDDPGIRAVTARSADAISDFADSLARKATNYGNPGNAPEALEALARAAERHAATLRATSVEPDPEPTPTPSAAAQAATTTAPSNNREADARAIQEAARRVAQRAQQRLGAPARPQGGNVLRAPERGRANQHPAHAQRQATEQQSPAPGISTMR